MMWVCKDEYWTGMLIRREVMGLGAESAYLRRFGGGCRGNNVICDVVKSVVVEREGLLFRGEDGLGGGSVWE